MRYQCEKCNKTFSHPRKQIDHYGKDVKTLNFSLNGEKISKEQLAYLRTELSRFALSADYLENETYVCPFCDSMAFKDFDAPKPDIVSMKSVDIKEVDELLKQGYKVKESSTTKACLVKYAEVAPKDAQPDVLGEIIQAGIEEDKKNAV